MNDAREKQKGRARWETRPFRKWFETMEASRGSSRFSGHLSFGCAGLGLQRILGALDQTAESGRVGDRNLGELATVELDVSGLETLDEAAVTDTGFTAGGIQTHDPKTAHVGLLLLAIDVGVLPGVLDRFLGVAEQL